MISHSRRIDLLREFATEMKIFFDKEADSAYLARAVSSVPVEQRPELEEVFQEIILGVEAAGLEAKLPVELGDIDKNLVNPGNHELLINSKFVVPLTYAISDGRGWEMGFSYGRKATIPIVMPDQKINIPSLRLPFIIPIVWQGKENLTEVLKELKKYTIGFGELENGPTVIGALNGTFYDLRKEVGKIAEVVPYRI